MYPEDELRQTVTNCIPAKWHYQRHHQKAMEGEVRRIQRTAPLPLPTKPSRVLMDEGSPRVHSFTAIGARV